VVTTLTIALLVPFERLAPGLITCLAMMKAAFFQIATQSRDIILTEDAGALRVFIS
jgi:hypothetical protein